VQLAARQQPQQRVADRDRADRVSVAPDQADRELERRQLRAVVRRVAGDPRPRTREFCAIFVTPLTAAEAADVDAARRRDQHQASDLARPRKRQPDRDNAAHRLGHHVAAVRHQLGRQRHKIRVTVDSGQRRDRPRTRPAD
jgi:hypothetical protein